MSASSERENCDPEEPTRNSKSSPRVASPSKERRQSDSESVEPSRVSLKTASSSPGSPASPPNSESESGEGAVRPTAASSSSVSDISSETKVLSGLAASVKRTRTVPPPPASALLSARRTIASVPLSKVIASASAGES